MAKLVSSIFCFCFRSSLLLVKQVKILIAGLFVFEFLLRNFNNFQITVISLFIHVLVHCFRMATRTEKNAFGMQQLKIIKL